MDDRDCFCQESANGSEKCHFCEEGYFVSNGQTVDLDGLRFPMLICTRCTGWALEPVDGQSPVKPLLRALHDTGHEPGLINVNEEGFRRWRVDFTEGGEDDYWDAGE